MKTDRDSQDSAGPPNGDARARQERMTWGSRVSSARKRLGLTQEDLAAAAGVSVGTVKNIESSKTAPQKAKLDAVLDVLALTRKHTDRWTDDQWRIAEVAVALFDQLPVSRQPEAAGRMAALFAEMLRDQS